jgi:hypothetical protein
MGLHRMSGTSSSTFSVLEAEIRRRVWWQIIILDSRACQVSGVAPSVSGRDFEKPIRPLNINDSDLSPNMREPPIEHTGVTEMLFCSVRYEIGDFMMLSQTWKNLEVETDGTDNNGTSMAAKDKAIDELEDRLEQKFLRHCDPSIPLHLLSTIMAQSAICRMRLIARRVYKRHGTKTRVQPQSEKDEAFQLSLKMIEFDNIGHGKIGQEPATRGSLKGFMWHVNVFFQIEGFINILSELRHRTTGDLIDWAWKQIELSYEYHPEMLVDTKNALWFAVGNLAVKAWEQHAVAVAATKAPYQLTTPKFIAVLLSQRAAKGARITNSILFPNQRPEIPNEANVQLVTESQGLETPWDTGGMTSGVDFSLPSSYLPTDEAPMDWEYWQTLVDDAGLPMFT